MAAAEASPSASPVAQLGQAEVEDAHVVAHAGQLAQHDVARLDVAMDDALAVRVGQAVQRLAHDRQRARHRHRPRIEHVAQCGARHEVHDDVRRVLHAEVDHRHAVRVRQLAHRARLALEARHELGRAGIGRVQELDGHGLAQLQPLTTIHEAHAAFAEQSGDPVATTQHGANAWVFSSFVHQRGLSVSDGGAHAPPPTTTVAPLGCACRGSPAVRQPTLADGWHLGFRFASLCACATKAKSTAHPEADADILLTTIGCVVLRPGRSRGL